MFNVQLNPENDDFKTNLANNGLHSLNMGEVRHVCRLKNAYYLCVE